MGISTTTPPSFAYDGNLLVLAAKLSDATGWPTTIPGAAALAGTKWVDVTYSLTADGWAETASQDNVTDDRLTLAQVLANPGKTTEGLTVKYVFTNSSTNDIADPLFVQNSQLVFAVRRGVPHAQAIASGDVFDFYQVKAGVKQNDAPAANSIATRTQVMYPQIPSMHQVAIAS